MVKSRRSASCRQSRPKRDLGVTAVGLDVLAQRGDLERRAVDHHGDGAVLDAGRHRLEAGGLDAAHHLLRHAPWWRRRSSPTGIAEQRVAHRAADHARLLAVAVEHVEQPRQRAGAAARRSSSRRSVRPVSALTFRLPRHEFAVLDMRRHIGRARRRAGEIARSRRSCRSPAQRRR